MADLIDSLIGYVNDVKPYHTKIFGVEVEYVVGDSIELEVTEDFKMKIFMGLPVNEMKQLGEWSRERWIPGVTGPRFDTATNTWDLKEWDAGYVGDPISSSHPGVSIDRPNRAHEAVIRSLYGSLENANIPLDNYHDESYRQAIVYPNPTGFMDLVFAKVTENLQIGLDVVGGDVDDIHNFTNPLWDETYEGIDIAGTSDNVFYVNGNYEDVFNDISQFEIQSQEGLNVGFGSSSFDQRPYDEFSGEYTVVNAVYDETSDITLIRVIEDVPIVNTGSFSYGKIKVGLWDAGEWDGYKDSHVNQPDADLNASPEITECFEMVDGYTYDSPMAAGFDSGGYDEGTYILKGKNTIPRKYDGYDYSFFDTELWDHEPFFIREKYDAQGLDVGLMDSGTNVRIIREDEIGIVVFSYDDLPTPNPVTSRGSSRHDDSADWVVTHNLGYTPIVRAYDTGYNQIEPLEVIRVSSNTILVRFTSPTSGYLRLF